MTAESKAGELREHTAVLSALSTGFMNSYVLFTANQAGVSALLEEPRTAESVAAALGWDPRGARMLLDGLVALRLAAKTADGYQNTAIASACLVPGKPGYQGHIIEHQRNSARWWPQLPEAVRTGTGVQREREDRSPEELRAFILGMNDIAKQSAEDMLPLLDLSSFRHMLDLGGGPGTYTLTFLGAYPALTATIFDRPEVIEIARKQVQGAGQNARVTYRPGDMVEDDIGSGYDFVLISNIIHSFGPDTNRRLIQKVFDALEPGGMLVIKDFLTDNDRSGPAFSLLFALRMLVATEQGDTYSFAEVEAWTREAGFETGRVIDLTPQTRLWAVNKPGRLK